jgi:D-alanyl-D-alanine-carboxypeptidase/D-alanyl-D-alanine-endopeptidase
MKIFLYIVLGLVVIVLGIVGFAYYKLKNVEDTKDLEKRLETMALNFIKKGHAPGLGLAVVKGDKVYVHGYGKSNIEKGEAVTENTIFEIGSVTKTFTTLMLQQFVNEGQMKLSDRMDSFFPAGFGPIPKDSVTLFNLATHTSGYPRVPEALLNQMKDSLDPYRELTEEMLFAYLRNPTDKQQVNLKEPDYTNLGMGLLGHILEWKSGKSYGSLLQEKVLNPLAMQNSYYQGLETDTHPNLAQGYDENIKPTPHWAFQILGPAGAIRSTPADMAKYLKANLMESLDLVSKVLKQAHKSCNEKASIPQGLGWWIDNMSGKILGLGDIVWHNGGTGGFSSYIGFCPNEKVGVVLLTNRFNEETDKLAVKMLFEIKNVSFAGKD